MDNHFILPHVIPSTEQRDSGLKGISSTVTGIPGAFAAEDPHIAVHAEPSFEVHTTMSTSSRDAESLLTTGSTVSPTSAERAQSNIRK